MTQREKERIEFLQYLTKARNVFASYIANTFPPGEGYTKTRVQCEDILIAFDQVKSKYEKADKEVEDMKDIVLHFERKLVEIEKTLVKQAWQQMERQSFTPPIQRVEIFIPNIEGRKVDNNIY